MAAALNILGHTPDHDFDEPIGLLTDCHRRIEMFLELLQRAVREHAGAPLDTPTAAAIRNAQQYFAKAAPKHTADEEESLFPRLRAAAATQGQDCSAIVRLEGDHEQADRLHAQVNGLLEGWLSDGSLPAERFTELGTILATLRELYREHIHLEEAEVFPLAGSLLSPTDLSAVGSEMRARRGLRPPE
ncbi:MAG: hemerythrin domain-containing protein [Phycisphaerae bacterium]|jgi:hemerythrin-like domain-containing protein|nr:hemerythrin domain-containing protein [Phycisphaerae bacterium]